jgi:Amt family ammonium transporter
MLIISVVVLGLAVLAGPEIAWAQDATGADIQSGVPLEGPVEDRVLHNEAGLNLAWLVLGAILVIFMQSGFAMLEVGLARAKNASHVAMQNFTIFGIGLVAYFAVGYGLQFGAVAVPLIGFNEPIGGIFPSADFGLFGTRGFFLIGAYDPAILAFFLFQAAFMDTAATIPTGAMAERWRFTSFIWWGLFCGALYFPLYGAWVWGGGWLSTLGQNLGLGNGVVDFAGAGVVHAMGGMAALTGALVLGPRRGKYTRDGRPRVIPGHNVPLSLLGSFILLVGWFGFNAASTFAATDLRFAVVAANTGIAAAAGMVAALFTSYARLGKPDPGYVGNGMLGGLVAITGSCAFVAPWAAFVIGACAGVLVVFAMLVIERVVKVDDPAGAVAVHGVCGLFGVLSVGIFADGTYGAGYNGVEGAVTGILYGGSGAQQLAAQVISCVVIVLFGGGLSYAFFRIQNSLSTIRSSEEDEIAGLDVEEIGVLGYADYALLADADVLDLSEDDVPVREPEPHFSPADWQPHDQEWERRG